jgi:hypothetical protein
MTDEEINEAIALKLGWAKCACGDIRCGAWFPPGTSDPNKAELGVPSFCKDLNAMHEAEKGLVSLQWVSYSRRLQTLCDESVTWPIHATASQRAEAFLRTIGKWKEVSL